MSQTGQREDIIKQAGKGGGIPQHNLLLIMGRMHSERGQPLFFFKARGVWPIIPIGKLAEHQFSLYALNLFRNKGFMAKRGENAGC